MGFDHLCGFGGKFPPLSAQMLATAPFGREGRSEGEDVDVMLLSGTAEEELSLCNNGRKLPHTLTSSHLLPNAAFTDDPVVA